MSKKVIASAMCCECGKCFDVELITNRKKLAPFTRQVIFKEGKGTKVLFGPGAVLRLDDIVCNECVQSSFDALFTHKEEFA